MNTVQVGNPFGSGPDVFPAIPDTVAINAVAGISLWCRHDETVLKPCSLVLIRAEPPAQLEVFVDEPQFLEIVALARCT